MKFLNCTLKFYCRMVRFLDTVFSPFLFLVIRLWMANIFFKSGLTKIGSWQTTVSLFSYEYKTPFFGPEVAAYLATSIELIAPVFIAIGLLTRLAAIPMLIMTLFIQFTYKDLPEHYYWMMLISLLILKDPGVFSFDYWLKKRWCNNGNQ